MTGQTFPLGSEALTLGRERTNALQLRDLAVSRQHCVIEPWEGGVRLRDLESRHGTFVNGVPVRERVLQPGDRIAVGGSMLLALTAAEEANDSSEMAPVLWDEGSYTARTMFELRVLQEREFERLGGTRPIRVDVRVLAATNRDLEKAMKEGSFREDLYYRLNVIQMMLPPLRERREDIPLLASHFAALAGRKLGRPIQGFTPEARACLLRYSWLGNVRELANAVERAVVLGDSELIGPEDLPESVIEAVPVSERSPVAKYHETLNDTKRRLILSAIEEAEGTSPGPPSSSASMPTTCIG